MSNEFIYLNVSIYLLFMNEDALHTWSLMNKYVGGFWENPLGALSSTKPGSFFLTQ